MIKEKNKVGSELKSGIKLDYSDSRQWNDIIVAALEDIENGANSSLDMILTNVIAEKKYAALTGAVRETLPFERSELESPKTAEMNNRQKNNRLVSNRKKDQITEEFWQNEFIELKSNVLNDYTQLKDKITTGQLRIKPKEAIKRPKQTNLVGRMINSLTPSFKSTSSKANKNQVISIVDGELPVATEIHFTHAKYVIGKLKEYHEAAVIMAEKSETKIVIKPSVNPNISSRKPIFRR